MKPTAENKVKICLHDQSTRLTCGHKQQPQSSGESKRANGRPRAAPRRLKWNATVYGTSTPRMKKHNIRCEQHAPNTHCGQPQGKHNRASGTLIKGPGPARAVKH